MRLRSWEVTPRNDFYFVSLQQAFKRFFCYSLAEEVLHAKAYRHRAVDLVFMPIIWIILHGSPCHNGHYTIHHGHCSIDFHFLVFHALGMEADGTKAIFQETKGGLNFPTLLVQVVDVFAGKRFLFISAWGGRTHEVGKPVSIRTIFESLGDDADGNGLGYPFNFGVCFFKGAIRILYDVKCNSLINNAAGLQPVGFIP